MINSAAFIIARGAHSRAPAGLKRAGQLRAVSETEGRAIFLSIRARKRLDWGVKRESELDRWYGGSRGRVTLSRRISRTRVTSFASEEKNLHERPFFFFR